MNKDGYKKVYARVKDGGKLNTFGNIEVEAIHRLWSGRYRARATSGSVLKPLFCGEDSEGWFSFKKDYPLCFCNNSKMVKLEKGEYCLWVGKINMWVTTSTPQ